MRTSLGIALLVVGLIAAACGSAQQSSAPTLPISSQQPSDSQQPSTSQQPMDTNAPGATDNPPATSQPGQPIVFPDLNVPPELPQPEFTTADEVVEAMFQPGLEGQAIVSMLDQLGIGIYSDDGELILAGTDQSATDFYVIESEVRGLIDMLHSAGEEPWIDFTDFHEALVALGVPLSAEELAEIYNDAYAATPDEPITMFVQANAFISTDAQLSPLGVWLMLLDGFVPPNSPGEAAGLAGGTFVAQGRSGRGIVIPGIEGTLTQSQVRLLYRSVRDMMAVQAMVRSSQIVVELSKTPVHEGHGGLGETSNFKASLRPCGGAPPPGRGPQCSVPAGGNMAGMSLTWTFDSSVTEHGSTSIASGSTTSTDGNGSSTVAYTAFEERPEASRNGFFVTVAGTVRVSVAKSDIIQRIYNLPAQAAQLVGGGARAEYTATQLIEWHEPNVLRMEIINPYDVTITEALADADTHQWGTDSFSGDLILDETGNFYRGVMVGRSNGNWTGKGFGAPRCSNNWNATQLLEVTAKIDLSFSKLAFTFKPIDDPTGMPGGRCRPTIWKSPGGKYFAPYIDTRILADDALVFDLLDKPGGSYEVDVPPGPPNWRVKDTLWHVRMEYLGPP